MTLTVEVGALITALPDRPTSGQLLNLVAQAEELGFTRGQSEMRARYTLVPINPAHVAKADTVAATIVLENRIGNPLTPERLRQIEAILRHFNWKTERAALVEALSQVSVHGDVDAIRGEGSFYDYRQQGWVVARVVAA